MPELRFDPTTGGWVVFAPLRQLRPRTLEKNKVLFSAHDLSIEQHCPFCPGNETQPQKSDLGQVDLVWVRAARVSLDERQLAAWRNAIYAE